MSSIVLFGGSGFVGRHLRKMIFDQKLFDTVYIADIRPPHGTTGICEKNDGCKYIACDVRKPIGADLCEEIPSCIVNLAAVHTSPGHPSNEYFETNILGARNVCAYAEAAGISTIVFTSSISVYGPGEDEKSEDSIQMPAIPYGSSKAIAEYIHREWYNRDAATRSLSIVRPGVIFGPGEGGNFTRIANALEKGFFPLPGRTDTIKACLYVKDICRFILSKAGGRSGYCLYNFCLPRKITIGEIVAAFKKILGYKAVTPVIPLQIITCAVSMLGMMNLPVVRKMGMVPERVVKLVRSTNISSRKLVDSGFAFTYDLEEALEDWSRDCGGAHLF